VGSAAGLPTPDCVLPASPGASAEQRTPICGSRPMKSGIYITYYLVFLENYIKMVYYINIVKGHHYKWRSAFPFKSLVTLQQIGGKCMAEHTKLIQHKGIPIIFNDFTNLQAEELAVAREASTQAILDQPNKRPLILTDITGSFTNAEITQKGKDMNEVLKAKGIEPILALVGVNGAKRVLASAVVKGIHFAKDMEEAKDWLVEHAGK
jgi:hypothetical protein